MSEDVASYFTRNGVKFKKQSGSNLEFTCPQCGKADKAQIHSKTWLWQCHSGSCDAKGNELTLKRSHGVMYDIQTPTGESIEQAADEAYAAAMKARNAASTDVERWHHDLMHSAEAAGARSYLQSRGLQVESWKAGLLGFRVSKSKRTGKAGAPFLAIPSLTEPGNASTCAMVKMRNLNPNCTKKQRYRRLPDGTSVLFMPRKLDVTKTVLIVGGELDALSVVQAGFDNVVSSTLGEGNWDDIFTRQLEQVEDFVIVYDSDDAGKEGAQNVVTKLGQHRCRIGVWPDGCSDANDALMQLGNDFDIFTIHNIINAAKAQTIDGIIAPSVVRERLRNKLRGGSQAGWSTGFKDLDLLVGGIRPGELSLWTGDTGCGKTSMTSQLALTMARAGHGVMYCPFEMNPVRQLEKWLRQTFGDDPAQLNDDAFDSYADQIEALPLWMFYLNEQVKPEAMRNTLLYAAKRLDVKLIVVDHINAMTTSGRDERAALDALSQMFFKVCELTNMHIAVIAHPRSLGGGIKDGRDRDNHIVQLGDIKGTSALKQDCDLAFSVKRPRKADRSDVIDADGFGKSLVFSLKCRSEYGSEGSVSLRYNPKAACMLDDVPEKPKTRAQAMQATWHDDF